VPVLREADTAKVLEACRGKGFVGLRDEALIRLYANTGAHLSEVGRLLVTDVDMNTESVHFHGKVQAARIGGSGSGPRRLGRCPGICGLGVTIRGPIWRTCGWRDRGGAPLTPNGIKIRLKRLGQAAGVPDLHAHRWRHSFAHEWKLAGADTGDLMLLLGWASEDMPRRYGASAAAERAMATQQRIGIGERV
jgi:integrase